MRPREAIDHGRQPPPSHRGLRSRRRRRACDVTGRRARGTACLGTRPRRHAVWRAARQSRRSDQKSAARHRRRRARAGAAGAAAGHLPHRLASPAKRHATYRRARRDQARFQRRRFDAAERRRRPYRAVRHHARRRQHPAADTARPGALPRRTRHPHHRLRDHRQRRQRHLAGAGLRRYHRQYLHQYRERPPWCRSTRRA